jgi:hypothetical protein
MDIQFLIYDQDEADYFPVKPANKAIPAWYRDLGMWQPQANMGNGLATIKHCMPVQDMLTTGYVIFNTYEAQITPFPSGPHTDYHVECPSKNYVSGHEHAQCPVKITGREQHYFKIKQPWTVKTPPGYSCLFIQPFYHFEDRYTLMPSIVDTDSYDLPVEIPGWANTANQFTIDSGAPLMQVIPFKRDSWTMSIEHTEPKRSLINFIITGGYRKIFHKKKTFK